MLNKELKDFNHKNNTGFVTLKSTKENYESITLPCCNFGLSNELDEDKEMIKYLYFEVDSTIKEVGLLEDVPRHLTKIEFIDDDAYLKKHNYQYPILDEVDTLNYGVGNNYYRLIFRY